MICRQNMYFMNSEIQELITSEFKNQRDSLILFEYTDCKLLISNTKGKLSHVICLMNN